MAKKIKDLTERLDSKSQELKDAKPLKVDGLQNLLRATAVSMTEHGFLRGVTRDVTCHFLYHHSPEYPDDYLLITVGVNFVFTHEGCSVNKFTTLPVSYHKGVLDSYGVREDEQDRLFNFLYSQLETLEKRYTIHVVRVDSPIHLDNELN